MNVQTLINLLVDLADKHGNDVEVRIGDQIEDGPYSHDRVGGVWTNRPDNAGGIQYVVLCAEDTQWHDELVYGDDFIPAQHEMPLLWKPPAPFEKETVHD